MINMIDKVLFLGIGDYDGFVLFFNSIIGIFLLILVFWLAYIAGLFGIFKKAGRDGWEAIIPYYNNWVLVEISGLDWWYAAIIIGSSIGIFGNEILLLLLSIANLVAHFFLCYNLSKRFNKDIANAILMFFFPFIMFPIMGFSKNYYYDKSIPVSKNGPINLENNYNSNNTVQSNINSSSNNFGVCYCQYCGRQNDLNAKFCVNCGHEIKK